MSIWTKPLTSPETDAKIAVVRKIILFGLLSAFVLGVLAVWTLFVVALREYAYKMAGMGAGAGSVEREGWMPYAVLWSVPVLIMLLLGLIIRAALRGKKNEKKA